MGKFLEKYEVQRKIISTPYNVYRLKNRRRRKINFASSPARCRIISSSCCSSLSSSEFINNFGTVTSEINAIPQVDDDQTSSNFVECNNTNNNIKEVREFQKKKTSDNVDITAAKSTVEITSMTVMPTEFEIEEFFCSAENNLHKCFSEKYNFDIVRDVPLEGRYEWIEIKP